MQYYAEHLSTDRVDESLNGTFTVKYNNEYFIKTNDCDLVPVKNNNRALHGDQVYYHNDVDTGENIIVGIKERLNHQVPGVIILNKTKIMGKNTKNVPIYQCSPVDSKYPNFTIASNIKKNLDPKLGVKNYYVLIQFHQWTAKQKFPMARQISVIGHVGDLNSELKVILYNNKIFHKHYRNVKLSGLAEPRKILYERRKFTDNVYAIDPQGAKDFDDAFHVVIGEYGKITEIGVHIADVTAYFNETGCYENEILKRLSTIYMINGKYNMIPDKFADNMCSLKAGEPRLAVSVIFGYGGDSDFEDVIISQEFVLSEIVVSNNMTYEYANELLARGDNQILNSLADLFKVNDSHVIVEKLMIMANAAVGKRLYEAGYGLIRTQQHCTGKFDSSKADVELAHHLLNRSSTSAEYHFNPEYVSHFRLGMDYYTHFTSPIRRYPDILVHRLLKTFVIGSDVACTLESVDIEMLCQRINVYYKQIKRMYRQQDILKLYHIINEEHAGIYVTKGVPVEYNAGVIYVFLPEFDLEYKYRIYSKKIAHLVTETISDNKIEFAVAEETSLINLYNIELYKEYDVQLITNTVTTYINHKIKLRLQ